MRWLKTLYWRHWVVARAERAHVRRERKLKWEGMRGNERAER